MIFPTKSWMDCCGSNGLPSNVFQYCTISFIDPKESSSSFKSLSPYLVMIIRIFLSSLLLLQTVILKLVFINSSQNQI